MSSIVQLTIQGIRSFGIKAEDKQSITFSSPVTLILGANGCGKTTIIECLKYALTGELPPGSDRGKSFVHDPKIFDSLECLGQVKLQVKNIRGELLTVTRSVKVSHKRGRGNPSFDALDATVTYGNESISKRVVDVDTEVIQFMGVSKAILNNVIFCHQENASWPLDEPKKLKEKFDAIFGTTKYDKTIEKMIKIKKEQEDLLKQRRIELKYAEVRKKETDSKNLDLEIAKQKKNDLKEACLKINEELKPIEERLTTIQKIEFEIGKYHAEKIKMQTEIKNCSDQIDSLKVKIKKEFDGSIPQLDREIRNFHENMNEKKSELINLEDLLITIKKNENKLQNQINELECKRTSLMHQRQQEQELIGERATKMMELCDVLNISTPYEIETANDQETMKVCKQIETAFISKEKEIHNLCKSHEKIDQEKQDEIDKCRENKAKIESDLQSKRNQKLKQESESHKLKTQIDSNELNCKKLSSITEKVKQMEKLIIDFEAKINFEQMKNDIENKKTNIKNKQEQYRRLDEKLTFLNSISKMLGEVNLKEKELEKREQEIKKLKNKHGDNMKTIFPNEKIESNYKRKFQTANDDIQKKLKDLQEKENSFRLKLKGLEIERKNKKEEITKWEKEFEENKDKLFDKFRDTPYEEVFARSKETVEKYQLELGALQSSESMFKKYMKNIEQDPCCPLCHKNLSQNEATEVTSEMSDEIRRVPANVRKTKELLKKEQKNYESIMSLKSVIEKNEKLQKDIPKSKELLKKIDNQIVELTSEIESCQMLLAEPSSNIELISSMLGDMALLDEALKEMLRFQGEIRILKEKLPKQVESSNIDDVQLEKSSLSVELESERNELEKLESDYEREKNYVNKIKEKKLELKDTQHTLQEGIQSLPQLKIRFTEISNNLKSLSIEIEELDKALKPLKSKLDNLIKEKDTLKNINRNILNEANNKLDELKKSYHDVERYNKELKILAEANLEEEIEKLKKLFKRVLDEQIIKNKENSETTEKIENLKIQISNQELLERDLNDNRELKILQQKNVILNEKYEDLKKEIGTLKFDDLSKERKNLIDKRDSITDKRGKILGQTGEIEIQIEKLENELKQPQFKDSLKNYRKFFYEVEVLIQVINDLKEYNFALHKALIQYHSEKMRKINTLIRTLWRQIYRGNDIDHIEIKTEDDDIKTSASDKRRTFNYSVVQSKNNSKIEMRGRCSAGQRVLASLIIRMALAETFSLNCGVLALDEPTTNLDRNNITSLCETLNRIVEERRTQCNFMLIIITHDEDFISTLGRIRSYHKVSRNSEGKSVIRKTVVA